MHLILHSDGEEDDDGDAVADRRRAARVKAENCRIVIAPCKAGGYVGYSLEFPTIVTFAMDRHACIDAAIDDHAAAIEVALEHGLAWAGDNQPRDVLLNLRVSEDEKARLTEAAERCGQNLSEYMRRAGLHGSAAKAPPTAPTIGAKRKSSSRRGR